MSFKIRDTKNKANARYKTIYLSLDTIKTVSYTHLDVYKRQVRNARSCFMMSGKERREEILQRITNSKTPVSGAALAKSCEVSRQVIVQDIALILSLIHI